METIAKITLPCTPARLESLLDDVRRAVPRAEPPGGEADDVADVRVHRYQCVEGGKGRVPGWARRIAFPLKGGSSAGHPGQSRDRAWEGKREDGEEDTGAPCRRAHAAVCAKGGGRHQEPNPLFQVLPEAADGEGHDRKNRSGQSEIAQTGVQAGMSYYINNTMSIDSDTFAPLPQRSDAAFASECDAGEIDRISVAPENDRVRH